MGAEGDTIKEVQHRAAPIGFAHYQTSWWRKIRFSHLRGGSSVLWAGRIRLCRAAYSF